MELRIVFHKLGRLFELNIKLPLPTKRLRTENNSGACFLSKILNFFFQKKQDKNKKCIDDSIELTITSQHRRGH